MEMLRAVLELLNPDMVFLYLLLTTETFGATNSSLNCKSVSTDF